MGTDKALVRLGGQTLVAHAIGTLRQAGLAVSIAGGQEALAAFAPLVEDPQSGLGPLSGICAALESSRARLAVFLPVDMPMLPASLVQALLQHAAVAHSAVTLASLNGFALTFPAVLDRLVLHTLRDELTSGRGGCIAAFRAAAAKLGEPVAILPVEMLVQTGQVTDPAGQPPVRWFLNVNTEEDLRRAEVFRQAFIA
jgi:molybdopterin-guanine dinucleotide biosynthesis protein A